MRFAVETWATEYGASTEVDIEPTADAVDTSVECPPAQWAPIEPAPGPLPGAVLFVDGVRRIDARVWITDDGGLVRPGVCATVAAGAVRCSGDRAELVAAEVRRHVVSTGSVEPILTAHGTYEPAVVAEAGNDQLYLGVHSRMTALEQLVAADPAADLVVVDGPLRGRDRVVGYIKTHHVRYLPDPQLAVVAALGPGGRSPLFLIGGGFPRWSWFLRLPGPLAHPMSGVIRAELPGTGTVADAVSTADTVSRCLVRFASEGHKDPRAPQNLYPIAGLERELRRRLGDPALLERALRTAAG